MANGLFTMDPRKCKRRTNSSLPPRRVRDRRSHVTRRPTQGGRRTSRRRSLGARSPNLPNPSPIACASKRAPGARACHPVRARNHAVSQPSDDGTTTELRQCSSRCHRRGNLGWMRPSDPHRNVFGSSPSDPCPPPPARSRAPRSVMMSAMGGVSSGRMRKSRLIAPVGLFLLASCGTSGGGGAGAGGASGTAGASGAAAYRPPPAHRGPAVHRVPAAARRVEAALRVVVRPAALAA